MGIRDYIAERSPASAERVVRKIVAAAERLQMFPRSGELVAEFAEVARAAGDLPPLSPSVSRDRGRLLDRCGGACQPRLSERDRAGIA